MNYKLLHGDCLDIMRDIHDNSIDLVLCDLPYGVTARNKWDVVIPLDKLWEQYKRVGKENAVFILHCQQPFTTTLIESNRKDFKYCLYWFKHQTTGFLNAKKQPLRCVEELAVFYRKQPTYNPQMREGKLVLKNTGHDSTNYRHSKALPHYSNIYYPTQLIDIPQRRFKGGHPTQKPVQLLEYIIKTYSNPGDTVLDNTMGSGSTGVACINTNRNFIGIEIDPGYYSMATKRMYDAERRTVDL